MEATKSCSKFALLAAAALVALSLAVLSIVAPSAHADEVTDPAVLEVIAQLEAIDTLQEMQDARGNYKASGGHYDTSTTNPDTIASHEKARADYESYVSEMFAARIAAQQAYDALSDDQKAQIDPTLVAKLSNELPTLFRYATHAVTPRFDEYSLEAVNGGLGYAYEVGNYMVAGNIPQTFVLVDTADGKTEWTPDGPYIDGQSNYLVTYCCDVETGLEVTSHYKRLNLEDSSYYSPAAARQIRAILQNAYPFITLDEMKERLLTNGVSKDFVDSLNRADAISATQLAIWTYANSDTLEEGSGYLATIDVPKNTGIYFTPLHDYTNELWEWLPGKKQRSYDARAEYRVNTLAYYLCNLPAAKADADQVAISNIEITRAEVITGVEGEPYEVGMYIYLNNGGTAQDNLTITATSFHENEDGTVTVTGTNAQALGGRSKISMSIKAHVGDTIKVVVEGMQDLGRGVYFYEPVGGRDASQCLVGISEGPTSVHAEKSFKVKPDIEEMGLRIFKTVKDTGIPLSDITFTVYNVVLGEGEVLSEVPTEEEIAKHKTPENKVGSVKTDVTGYASIELPEGIYMVVEEHNADKVKAPVDPFYVTLPMLDEVEEEDGTVVVKTINIVSIYPKNEPVTPPPPPPPPPPPSNIEGKFSIKKHDEIDDTIVLSGAEFKVYRAATTDDANAEIIIHDGTQYAAVPVMVEGEDASVQLTLTTGEDGTATSPLLDCGTYFLVETKAPAGYDLADEAFSVRVVPSAVAETTWVNVPNERGDRLPNTGGGGTAALLAVGGILAAGAFVALTTRKRLSMYE